MTGFGLFGVVRGSFKTFIYPEKDLDAAKTLYGTLLSVEPYAESPYYVGYKVGDLEIALDPNGHASGMTGPVGYWDVDDINKSLQLLLDAGAQTQQEAKDVGGGMLIALVKDAGGNTSGSDNLHRDNSRGLSALSPPGAPVGRPPSRDSRRRRG